MSFLFILKNEIFKLKLLSKVMKLKLGPNMPKKKKILMSKNEGLYKFQTFLLNLTFAPPMLESISVLKNVDQHFSYILI